MNTAGELFLQKAQAAALQAGHVFAPYAACEAALESSWGASKLAIQANNLFGQKANATSEQGATIEIPTREYLQAKWVVVPAKWIMFPDWPACFSQRMALLKRASGIYPHYAAALRASSGEEFVREVSITWSTDPERAEKVLSIYRAHSSLFAAQA